jgi:protein-S-isoprenylcysteine O-methyltransferase Ste14
MEKIKLLFRGLASVLIFSSILFACAGRINYTQGWIYFLTTFTTTLMSFFALRNKTALLKERSKVEKASKSWDKLLLGMSAIVFLITIILSGFDSGRYSWSPQLHWSFYLSGILLTIVGHSIFLAAQMQNQFFSTVVNIKTGGEHTVCDTGIYKLVRHPGYMGMTISLIGIPLLTGSLWSFIPTCIAIILLLTRTYLEDKTLKNELKGYLEYTNKTQYKLIPRIW